MIESKYKALNRTAHRLTLLFPAGTECRYWTGAKEGLGQWGVIRCGFSVMSSGEVVGWVSTHPACIACTHIEVKGKSVLDYLEAA